MKRSKKIIIGIVSIFAIVVFIGMGLYNLPSQRVKRQLSLGYKYLENKQYEDAIVAFSNAIAYINAIQMIIISFMGIM